eukprot:gene28766-34729_t
MLFSDNIPSKVFVDSKLNAFMHRGSAHLPNLQDHPTVEQPVPIKDPLKVPDAMGAQSSTIANVVDPPLVAPFVTTPAHSIHEHPPAASTPFHPGFAIDRQSVPVNSSYYRLHCPHGHLLSYWRPLTDRDSRNRIPYLDYGPKA